VPKLVIDDDQDDEPTQTKFMVAEDKLACAIILDSKKVSPTFGGFQQQVSLQAIQKTKLINNFSLEPPSDDF